MSSCSRIYFFLESVGGFLMDFRARVRSWRVMCEIWGKILDNFDVANSFFSRLTAAKKLCEMPTTIMVPFFLTNVRIVFVVVE